MKKAATLKKIFIYSLLFLLLFGIVAVYSSSSGYCTILLNSPEYYLKRHLLNIGAGALVLYLSMKTTPRMWHGMTLPSCFICILMLAMVLVQGEQTGGSSRWLKIEGVSFQPSEMSKLCCLLLCSHGLVGKRIWQTRFGSFMSKLIKVGFILVMIMLVLRQPDFGTSALLVLVSLAMLFIRGFRLRHMGIVSLMAFTTMLAIMFCKPYRVKRLISFFDPWSDTRASGYQLSRSIISIGSGGLSGVGLGESSQKLLHLPQSHTDFIYSIIGEEMGFLGLMALNLGFITFIISGSAISLGLTETYLKVLCTGVVIMIGLQALMHISVCLGLVPTKGITLPFISYGGSSTVISMAMSGILIGAAGRRRN